MRRKASKGHAGRNGGLASTGIQIDGVLGTYGGARLERRLRRKRPMCREEDRTSLVESGRGRDQTRSSLEPLHEVKMTDFELGNSILNYRYIPRRVPALGWALVASAFILAGVEGYASAEEPKSILLEWDDAPKSLQIDSDKFVGQRFLFECPARTGAGKDEPIHGTNVYSSRSPICLAALHAGVLKPGGGRVTMQLNPGIERYVGSKQNGVQSAEFPGTKRSLVFMDKGFSGILTPVQRKYAPRVTWNTKFTSTGLANIKLVGQRFVFNCPAAPDALPGRRVYGTDRYAFNSFICLAAVHAGRLTPAGGFVAVQMVEPRGKLEGSARNGIESKSGPAGTRQLIFPVAMAVNARASGS